MTRSLETGIQSEDDRNAQGRNWLLRIAGTIVALAVVVTPTIRPSSDARIWGQLPQDSAGCRSGGGRVGRIVGQLFDARRPETAQRLRSCPGHCLRVVGTSGISAHALWTGLDLVKNVRHSSAAISRRVLPCVHFDQPLPATGYGGGDDLHDLNPVFAVLREEIGRGDEHGTGQARVGVRAGFLHRETAVTVGQRLSRPAQTLLDQAASARGRLGSSSTTLPDALTFRAAWVPGRQHRGADPRLIKGDPEVPQPGGDALEQASSRTSWETTFGRARRAQSRSGWAMMYSGLARAIPGRSI